MTTDESDLRKQLRQCEKDGEMFVSEICKLEAETLRLRAVVAQFDAACRHESDDLPARVRAAWESLDS